MYLRDTLRLPAKGLRPSAHPFFINLLDLCGQRYAAIATMAPLTKVLGYNRRKTYGHRDGSRVGALWSNERWMVSGSVGVSHRGGRDLQ